jgi:hypothetical protein
VRFRIHGRFKIEQPGRHFALDLDLSGSDADLLYLTGKGRGLDGMVFYFWMDYSSVHDTKGVGSQRIVTEFKDLEHGGPLSSTVFYFHSKRYQSYAHTVR